MTPVWQDKSFSSATITVFARHEAILPTIDNYDFNEVLLSPCFISQKTIALNVLYGFNTIL